MKTLIPILYNIRSVHNVGSILRTCDGFGIKEVICIGYTPNPDKGLPHERERLVSALHKTALGAEETVKTQYFPNIQDVISTYKAKDFAIIALEQAPNSQNLAQVNSIPDKALLILGEEVRGIPVDILDLCDQIVEIPMHGKKESFNVSVAAGITLYALSLLGD